ncbi:MAG: type II secretion system F family protein [Deltaproteobacteria bacterium]|nr:type II secretion system F family protein [Deltaproteobacteria bacterium]MBW2069976.1 type II secretion system F family protein [Deltaproteobacteria bacterium]
MAEYVWVGINRKGKKKKGELDAENENMVRLTLRRQGIEPKKIKPKPKDIFANVKAFQPKVTEKDIVVMTRQFATMIDAGLPLVQCLDILYSQQDNRTFKRILKQVKEDVEEGSTFADALKKHPQVFDELFVNLVAAGEVGGILDIILNRLANYIEKAAKLKKKVKSAMTYPIVVTAIAVLVVAVILVFVIPVFQTMFADFGRALPLPTQIVVNLSNFVKGNILYMIVGLAILVFAFRRFYRTEKGRALVDRLILRVPIFGVLIRKVAVAKFTRTLGTMIGSGVPILDSLEIVAATAGNRTIEEAIRETRQSISEGRTIAEPLADSEVFPSMVVQMISVGEATGALDTMLGKIADFYDDEVDAAVEALTSMLEPFMMVFLGGTIGALVISMYLPIFQMAGAVGG